MRFEPIVPKRQVINTMSVQRRLEARMSTFTADLWRECADYEAPPSPNYVRTNTLKKSWSREVKWRAGVLRGIVKSSGNVAPYNVFVRGPKIGRRPQARAMGRRGWRSITEIWAQMWSQASGDFRRIIRSAGK